VTAICLYKRKLADMTKKEQGVAIKKILPEEK
jgi:hypothetical protein